ncbi:MAG: hypothetical protein RSG92_15385 [Pseudomonas sp.]
MTDDQQRAREQFEAWAKTEQYDICRCEEDNSRYLDKTTRQAFDAWNAALRAAPEGFVLVPVDSVLPCGCGCYRSCGTDLGGFDNARPQGQS